MLISQTAFEKFKSENWPPPVRTKTKTDFNVSLGLHGQDDLIELVSLPGHLQPRLLAESDQLAARPFRTPTNTPPRVPIRSGCGTQQTHHTTITSGFIHSFEKNYTDLIPVSQLGNMYFLFFACASVKFESREGWKSLQTLTESARIYLVSLCNI